MGHIIYYQLQQVLLQFVPACSLKLGPCQNSITVLSNHSCAIHVGLSRLCLGSISNLHASTRLTQEQIKDFLKCTLQYDIPELPVKLLAF